MSPKGLESFSSFVLFSVFYCFLFFFSIGFLFFFCAVHRISHHVPKHLKKNTQLREFLLRGPSPCDKTGLAPRRQCTFSSFFGFHFFFCLLFLVFHFFLGGWTNWTVKSPLAGFKAPKQTPFVATVLMRRAHLSEAYPTFRHGCRSNNSNNSYQNNKSKNSQVQK